MKNDKNAEKLTSSTEEKVSGGMHNCCYNCCNIPPIMPRCNVCGHFFDLDEEYYNFKDTNFCEGCKRNIKELNEMLNNAVLRSFLRFERNTLNNK